MVETDPEGRSISGCPLTVLIGVPACKTTLKVQRGLFASLFASRIAVFVLTRLRGLPMASLRERLCTR